MTNLERSATVEAVPLGGMSNAIPSRGPRTAGRAGRRTSDAVALTCLQDRVNVGALSVDVHQDHGLWAGASATRAFELVGQEAGVHVPAATVRIDEDRRGAAVDDGVGAGNERQRGAEDSISPPYPDQLERQMQCRRT